MDKELLIQLLDDIISSLDTDSENRDELWRKLQKLKDSF